MIRMGIVKYFSSVVRKCLMIMLPLYYLFKLFFEYIIYLFLTMYLSCQKEKIGISWNKSIMSLLVLCVCWLTKFPFMSSFLAGQFTHVPERTEWWQHLRVWDIFCRKLHTAVKHSMNVYGNHIFPLFLQRAVDQTGKFDHMRYVISLLIRVY